LIQFELPTNLDEEKDAADQLNDDWWSNKFLGAAANFTISIHEVRINTTKKNKAHSPPPAIGEPEYSTFLTHVGYALDPHA
jgi:hypothetical protein